MKCNSDNSGTIQTVKLKTKQDTMLKTIDKFYPQETTSSPVSKESNITFSDPANIQEADSMRNQGPQRRAAQESQANVGNWLVGE